MSYPYVEGYNPMIEMFPEHGETITIDSGTIKTDNGLPCVVLDDIPLTEDEVMTLVRHLLVNLEHARWLHFERSTRLRPID